MNLRVSGFLAAFLLVGSAAKGQAAASPPGFDVATIRLNNTGSHSWRIDSDAGYFNATNVPLIDMLQSAYDIRPDLISGEPDWVRTTHYDLHAKVVDADPAELKHVSNAQQREMFRAVLVDRFHLQAHVETKQLPVYDLVVAKGGSKLQASSAEDLFHGVGRGGTSTHNGHLTAHAVDTGQLEKTLAGLVHRTVIDKSGLVGTFDIQLDFAPDYGNGPSPEATDPPVFDALQRQLGLRLESARGQVNTLVVDHIEKPTEN